VAKNTGISISIKIPVFPFSQLGFNTKPILFLFKAVAKTNLDDEFV